MHTTHDSSFHRLGSLCGLGLLLAALGCSGGGSDSDTSTNSSTTDNTSSSTAPTTGDLTGTGSSSTSTSDATTGSTGSTTAPTTDPTTTEPTTTEPTTEATTGSTGTAGSTGTTSTTGDELALSFFVSSTGSPTGDLGGLAGADKRCQDLAAAVGAGARTWRAYLSAEKGPDDQPVHARDRIGAGPWYNADLVMIAADVADLHTKDGDADLFLDENGAKVPGQWEGSPGPNQHDILTGTNLDGTVAAGKTCADWTSDDPALFAQVGHSDGLGPMMSDAPMYRPWNSVHESGGCNDTGPKGGAGRVYCFAVD